MIYSNVKENIQYRDAHLIFNKKDEADNILYVTPSKTETFQKIFLTQSQSAWITIEWLSEELMEYAQAHYQEIFDLRPLERGKVVLFDKDIDSPRWHKSYLKTPKRDAKTIKGSYMYAGKDSCIDEALPLSLQPFLDFMNVKQKEDEYNQVIANWYADGNDFIAAHSDCQIGMKDNAGIAILSLFQDKNSCRELRFIPKKLKTGAYDPIYSQVKVATLHGCILTMYGDTQLKFRHKLPKDLSIKTSRISLTYRKF